MAQVALRFRTLQQKLGTRLVTKLGESAGLGKAQRWIVNDDTSNLLAGQMHKTAFLKLVAEALTNQISAANGAGLSDESCKTFAFWLAYYGRQDAAHIEDALVRLVGPKKAIACARDYLVPLIATVRERVNGRTAGVEP